jgi:hypothetical protein
VEVKFRKILKASAAIKAVKEALANQEEVGRLMRSCSFCALHAAILFSLEAEQIDCGSVLQSSKALRFLSVPGKGCWKNLHGEWKPDLEEGEFFEATKGFIAVFVDNCRTLAERRYRILTRSHSDWLSHYIRTQGR